MKKRFYLYTPLGGEPEIVAPRNIFKKLKCERAKSVKIEFVKQEVGYYNNERAKVK